MTKTEIALQYKNAVVLHKGRSFNKNYADTFTVNLMSLGFIPTQKLYEYIASRKQEQIVDLYIATVDVLRNRIGADVQYNPMYPNFPQQVMDASHCELFWNAILHYWTQGHWKPRYHKLPREFAFESIAFKEIDVINEKTFADIFTTLLKSNESLSDFDKKTVDWFLNEYDGPVIPPLEIPYKETLCQVAANILKRGLDITPYVATTTDVLRIATYLSDGDISLATNCKFVSLPKAQRRNLVGALEKVIRLEDLARHKGKWTRLAHSLHVGDHSERVYHFVRSLRENQPIATYAGVVENHIQGGDIVDAAKILTKRPGEFARRLDHMLRQCNASDGFTVLKHFRSVAKDVPTRILLQVWGHFQARNRSDYTRIAFPKGQVQKGILLEEPKERIGVAHIDEVCLIIRDTLTKHFKSLGDLGKVFVDRSLYSCPVPTQQRSASTGSFNTVARGTRLPVMGDGNTLRFFIYWEGRDIDLSATLHDASFNEVAHVSYTDLKSEAYQACHSGDITRAPNGASEFIDITMDKALAAGARYVVMNVLVYAGPTFAEHSKCYAGWMARSKPNSNEIYEPTTVQQKIDLTSETKNAMVVVFDLETREAVWTDLTMNQRTRRGGNNIESNRAGIKDTMKAIVLCQNKVSLGELFELHGQARGEIVEDKEDADVVFDSDMVFKIPEINAEFVV